MRSLLAFLAFLLCAAVASPACKKADDKAQPTVADPKAPADPAPAATAPGGTAPGGTAPTTPGFAETPPPGAVALSADTLQLAPVANRVGDKRSKTEDVAVIFQVTAGGKKIDVLSTEHKHETVEVLAVDAAGVRTKVKASYRDLKSTQTVNGKTESKPQALEGKTYVVWSAGGDLQATTADGAAVSEAELADLARANNEVGQPDVMDQILSGRPWKIGETYTLTAADLARLNARAGDPDRPAMASMTLTLDAFDTKQARFTMVSALRHSRGKDTLDIALTGPVVLELPSGRALAVTGEGSLKGTANGMPSSGTMKQTVTYQY